MKTNRYPTNWSTISWRVRQQAGWKCANCGRIYPPEMRHKLETHHRDGNPQNNDPDNLMVLCLPCHRYLQPRYRYGQLMFWDLFISR